MKSIPELSHLSKEESKRLWRKYMVLCLRHKEVWIGFIIYAIIGLSGVIYSLRIQPWFPKGYFLGGLAVAFGFLIFFQFYIAAIRRDFRAELEGRES
jgi:hypothetical protein